MANTTARFTSPYAGPFSLQNHPERDVSLTTTLFLGLRLARNTQLYFDPEIAGGKGFSGVNGIANAPNGELPRVASATPKPYLARVYVTQDFGFGDEKESVESDENQLGGARPMTRYSVTARPLHRHRFLRQQPLLARSAHPVHGLGRHVQRRLGLSRRHARLHLGLGARVPHAQLVAALRQRGRAASRQRPALRPPPLRQPRRHVRRRAALSRVTNIRAPSACSVFCCTPTPAPTPMRFAWPIRPAACRMSPPPAATGR